MPDIADQIESQLSALASLIGGSSWGAKIGKPRIYMRTCRGRKIFFDFPDCPTGDPREMLGGESLKVYIDDCGQSPRWYASQRRLAIEAHWRHGLALSAAQAGDMPLAESIMDCDDDDWNADDVDTAAGHFLNGRTAQAAESLGLTATATA